jgi:hypothetical protein
VTTATTSQAMGEIAAVRLSQIIHASTKGMVLEVCAQHEEME